MLPCLFSTVIFTMMEKLSSEVKKMNKKAMNYPNRLFSRVVSLVEHLMLKMIYFGLAGELTYPRCLKKCKYSAFVLL